MVNFKNLLSGMFIVLLLISSAALPLDKRCVIQVKPESGSTVKVNAEIAVTESDRETGLMYRSSLNESDGMLFVFAQEQKLNFWMKNTYIALDIAYIDRNGIINEIYQMKPLDTSVTYPSHKPAKYALEMNLGWFSRHKIKPGSKILFNGCLGK